MTKPFPLQPLLNLALKKNESATRRLGQLNKQEYDSQCQLDMLQQYRRDYQERMQAASMQGLDQATLKNYQQFIYKLDTAITQQKKAVEQSRISTQIGRGEFTGTQRKLKSFDTLQQRHIDQESKIEAKREQRSTDEHTSRVTAYKILNTETHK
jgi:flagellar FliJ protein